mgnify:CR=1 FL=1
MKIILKKNFSIIKNDKMLNGIFKVADANIYHNPSIPFIYEMIIRSRPANPNTRKSVIANNGAIVVYSDKNNVSKRIVFDK